MRRKPRSVSPAAVDRVLPRPPGAMAHRRSPGPCRDLLFASLSDLLDRCGAPGRRNPCHRSPDTAAGRRLAARFRAQSFGRGALLSLHDQAQRPARSDGRALHHHRLCRPRSTDRRGVHGRRRDDDRRGSMQAMLPRANLRLPWPTAGKAWGWHASSSRGWRITPRLPASAT